MKKIIFSFLVLVGLAASLPADELLLGEVPFLNMRSNSNDCFTIKYEIDKDEYYMKTSSWLGVSQVILKQEELEAFRGVLSKALDWAELANEKNLEVEKEIPDSLIEADVEWNWGVNRYRNGSWDRLKIRFLFSAVLDDDELISRLVLAAPRVTSSFDGDVTYRFPVVLLSEDEINTFFDVISQENIDEAIKKHEESEIAEDLFF